MHHQKIDDRSRVWIVMRGADGRLEEQLDPKFAANLNTAQSAEEIVDALVLAAGAMEVAETRLW